MFDDNSSHSGRVKGSIKDRIISFLYRKRFKIKLLKNRLIKKETRIIFSFHKKKEIKNYRDLKQLGDKVIEVDVKKEKFDFDKYDYYIIEPVKKKGIDTETIKDVEETKKIINTSKNLLNSVKKDIKKVDINLKYPDTHKEDLSSEINNIYNNVNTLKNELTKLNNIDISKLNYFKVPRNEEELKRSYEIIHYYENIINNKEKDNNIISTISNVSFKKNVGINVNNGITKNIEINRESIPKKNKANSGKISSIKNIKIYKTNKKNVDNKLESKKTIKVLNKFDGYKIRQLKRNEEIVKKDVDSALQ